VDVRTDNEVRQVVSVPRVKQQNLFCYGAPQGAFADLGWHSQQPSGSAAPAREGE